MSEEKDEATMAAEQAHHGAAASQGLPALVPQLVPSPGLPERQAVARRHARVMGMLHTLPPAAREAILASMGPGQAPAQPRAIQASVDDSEAGWTDTHAFADDGAGEPGRPGWWARRSALTGRHRSREPLDPAELEELEAEPGRWPRDWPGGGT